MKYLILLIIIAVIFIFIFRRMLPYIRMMRRFLGVMREVNRMRAPSAPSDMQRRSEKRTPTEPLVRCAVCGTWVAESRALTLRATQTTYCSHSCLERAADGPQRFRRTAS